mgnify:CR=1 FL=1
MSLMEHMACSSPPRWLVSGLLCLRLQCVDVEKMTSFPHPDWVLCSQFLECALCVYVCACVPSMGQEYSSAFFFVIMRMDYISLPTCLFTYLFMHMYSVCSFLGTICVHGLVDCAAASASPLSLYQSTHSCIRKSTSLDARFDGVLLFPVIHSPIHPPSLLCTTRWKRSVRMSAGHWRYYWNCCSRRYVETVAKVGTSCKNKNCRS